MDFFSKEPRLAAPTRDRRMRQPKAHVARFGLGLPVSELSEVFANFYPSVAKSFAMR